MVAVRHNIQRARESEFTGHGVFDRHLVHDVTIRHHVDCVFPMEDEQRLGLHHVPAILRIRRRQPNVRVRHFEMPSVNNVMFTRSLSTPLLASCQPDT